jgi:hypothetical protein
MMNTDAAHRYVCNVPVYGFRHKGIPMNRTFPGGPSQFRLRTATPFADLIEGEHIQCDSRLSTGKAAFACEQPAEPENRAVIDYQTF